MADPTAIRQRSVDETVQAWKDPDVRDDLALAHPAGEIVIVRTSRAALRTDLLSAPAAATATAGTTEPWTGTTAMTGGLV